VVATVLSAGLISYARIGRRLLERRGGWIGLAAVWGVAAVVCVGGLRDISTRFSKIPILMDTSEAAAIWSFIDQVGPDDAVIADYEVSAPLSSRRKIFSYVMDQNVPPGWPKLEPEFKWLFVKNDYPQLKVLLDQGFEVVYRCRYLTIARRD
jgi:hypothetical protein